MNSSELNLPLRTKILDIALNLEKTVNSILLAYLSIENNERKAISNKSGNLSFRNRIDLLYDLDIFTKEDHKTFLLQMEFRNQFLHNIECNSFTKAVEFLGPDKGKNLLKFKDENYKGDTEDEYNYAFLNLYNRTIQIAQDKIRERVKFIEDKANIVKLPIQGYEYVTDFLFKIVHTMFDKFEPADDDSEDTILIKVSMLTTLGSEIMKINDAEEYRTIQQRMNLLLESGTIRKYFK